MADPDPELVAKALRARKNPVNPKLNNLELRTRGYQLYKAEAILNGERVKSYEEWAAEQDPL